MSRDTRTSVCHVTGDWKLIHKDQCMSRDTRTSVCHVTGDWKLIHKDQCMSRDTRTSVCHVTGDWKLIHKDQYHVSHVPGRLEVAPETSIMRLTTRYICRYVYCHNDMST